MNASKYWRGVRYLEFDTGAVGEILRVYPDLPSQILGMSGCSAGGLVVLLLALNNFDVEQSIADARQLKWCKYVPQLSSLATAGKSGGLIKSSVSCDLLGELLEQKLGSAAATMADLYRKTAVWVRLRVVNLLKGEVVYLDHIDFPHMPVHTAVWASAAIPMLAEPVVCVSPPALYVDGGLLLNYSRYAFNCDDATHGFCVTNTSYKTALSTVLSNDVAPGCWYRIFLIGVLSIACAAFGAIEQEDAQCTRLVLAFDLMADLATAQRGLMPDQACVAAGVRSQRLWFERQMCLNVMAL